MRALRRSTLFTDFASFSKRRDTERETQRRMGGDNGGIPLASGSGHGLLLDGGRQLSVSQPISSGRGGVPHDAPDDPPVAMMLSAVNRAAEKTGRERKGVWAEFGKPYECGYVQNLAP